MQKMFKDKNAKPIQISMTSKKKPPTISINMLVVMTISYKNDDYVFKEKEPLKKKTTIDWTKEEEIEKTFVETIQQLHATTLEGKNMCLLLLKTLLGLDCLMWRYRLKCLLHQIHIRKGVH
jgi:hypothetical protein